MILALFFAAAAFSTGGAAAPCCSSSSAAPALISGDHATQVSANLSNGSLIGRASPTARDGAVSFLEDSAYERTQTFKLDGATLVSDRFQVGAGIGLVSRQIGNPSAQDSATRFGDLQISGGYEFLTEWSYSAWKPRGFVFVQVVTPTGRSIYDAEGNLAADATGKGFFSVSAGSLLTKKLGEWDFYVLPHLQYSIPRTFGTGADAQSVTPGWGASFAAAAGVSPGNGALRIGARLQPNYQQGKLLEIAGRATRAPQQLNWDTSIEGAYLFPDEWSLLASYTDQTLVGPAINSNLSRIFSVGLQHRWAR